MQIVYQNLPSAGFASATDDFDSATALLRPLRPCSIFTIYVESDERFAS